MTRQELDIILARLGLNVPDSERNEIAKAAHYIEEMAAIVRKPHSFVPEQLESFLPVLPAEDLKND